jgi:hypothetical protein
MKFHTLPSLGVKAYALNVESRFSETNSSHAVYAPKKSALNVEKLILHGACLDIGEANPFPVRRFE